MLQISFGNSLQFFNQIKSPDDFIFYLLLLFFEEVVKVAFVENNCPLFPLFVHEANIGKVVRKGNFKNVLFAEF